MGEVWSADGRSTARGASLWVRTTESIHNSSDLSALAHTSSVADKESRTSNAIRQLVHMSLARVHNRLELQRGELEETII